MSEMSTPTETSAMRKYREAQAFVDESAREMQAAEIAYRANRNDETRYALETAQYHWRRDMDNRMRRADRMTEEEYDALMCERVTKMAIVLCLS